MSSSESIRYATGDDALRVVTHKAIEMAEAQDKCERGYAQLGWLILEVATMQYWRVHHETFRDYLRSVALVSKKTPGQLQLYFLTVRDLSDTFKPAQLEAMGITKAVQLRAAKDYAIVLPAVLVNAALDPGVSVKDLKKLISTTLKLPSDDDGDWMDLEMEFMVSPEERALFEQVIDVAMHTDPLTKSTISRSSQMKDVMIKLAMEFLGAHSGDGQ
jgi:hypothetical protein